MENIHLILSIGATAIGFLASTVTFLYKFIKAQKGKIGHEQHLTVRKILLGLISEAEKFLHFTGAEKKEYVLQKVNEFITENNFTVDPAVISQTIDEIVAVTKTVNAK